MPELPEVQTIVNQLKDTLVGKKIAGVEIRLPKMFEGSRELVLGARIKGVRRRAKIIIIELDNGYNLAIHLKLTGQLIYSDASNKSNKSDASDAITFPNPIPFSGTALPSKHTHVVLKFGSGGRLFFNDLRQFGYIKVLSNEAIEQLSNEKLGPEPFSKEFTPEYLLKICSNWGRPIKLLLMEQSKISGIGNIYANEALWCAEISPMKRARDLAQKEPEKIKKLWECIRNVLELGIKYGGSSAADEAFVNAEGQPGHMQEHFVVYQQDGKQCPRCHHTIRRSQLGGRGTFFCPKCQN